MQTYEIELIELFDGIEFVVARIFVNGRKTTAYTDIIPEHLKEIADEMERKLMF